MIQIELFKNLNDFLFSCFFFFEQIIFIQPNNVEIFCLRKEMRYAVISVNLPRSILIIDEK